jgi:hypothetical protein
MTDLPITQLPDISEIISTDIFYIVQLGTPNVSYKCTGAQLINFINANIPTAPVLSVNGETGVVVLNTSNITDSTNARYVTDAELTNILTIPNLVPNTTTVNGHALSSNITITASDVGLGNVANALLFNNSGAFGGTNNATLDANGNAVFAGTMTVGGQGIFSSNVTAIGGGSGSTADGANQPAIFSGGSSPAAGNMIAISVQKSGFEEVFFGVNKNTMTGQIPPNAGFLSIYTNNGQFAIGRGNSSGAPNFADILIDSSGNTNVNLLNAKTGINVPFVAPTPTQAISCYVSPTGNDSTGARGDPAHPFATIAAAISHTTQAGDWIVLGNGTWNLTTTTSIPSLDLTAGAGHLNIIGAGSSNSIIQAANNNSQPILKPDNNSYIGFLSVESTLGGSGGSNNCIYPGHNLSVKGVIVDNVFCSSTSPSGSCIYASSAQNGNPTIMSIHNCVFDGIAQPVATYNNALLNIYNTTIKSSLAIGSGHNTTLVGAQGNTYGTATINLFNCTLSTAVGPVSGATYLGVSATGGTINLYNTSISIPPPDYSSATYDINSYGSLSSVNYANVTGSGAGGTLITHSTSGGAINNLFYSPRNNFSGSSFFDADASFSNATFANLNAKVATFGLLNVSGLSGPSMDINSTNGNLNLTDSSSGYSSAFLYVYPGYLGFQGLASEAGILITDDPTDSGFTAYGGNVYNTILNLDGSGTGLSQLGDIYGAVNSTSLNVDDFNRQIYLGFAYNSYSIGFVHGPATGFDLTMGDDGSIANGVSTHNWIFSADGSGHVAASNIYWDILGNLSVNSIHNNAAQEYDKGSVTGTSTIDWSHSSTQYITMAANVALTFSNPSSAGKYILHAAGAFTPTFPSNVRWSANTVPTPTAAAGKKDIYTFIYSAKESLYDGAMNPNYAIT